MTGIDIKISRLRAGLKGYELALILGITPDKMSQIEVGRLKPNKEMINRIKLALRDRQKK